MNIKIEPRARCLCVECGKEFRKRVGPQTFEVRCPKCGSADVDVY